MTRPYPATPRQQDALRFIAGYLEAHGGVSPTHGEMSAALGLAGKSGVTRILEALEERGQIRRLRHRSRAIELLANVPVPRAPDGAALFFIPAERVGSRLERGSL